MYKLAQIAAANAVAVVPAAAESEKKSSNSGAAIGIVLTFFVIAVGGAILYCGCVLGQRAPIPPACQRDVTCGETIASIYA